MPEDREERAFAWQPLTFWGVAQFGRASWGRLFLVQLAVALFTALTVIWFLGGTWIPTLEQAFGKSLVGARIEDGRLIWPDEQARRLARRLRFHRRLLWLHGLRGP